MRRRPPPRGGWLCAALLLGAAAAAAADCADGALLAAGGWLAFDAHEADAAALAVRVLAWDPQPEPLPLLSLYDGRLRVAIAGHRVALCADAQCVPVDGTVDSPQELQLELTLTLAGGGAQLDVAGVGRLEARVDLGPAPAWTELRVGGPGLAGVLRVADVRAGARHWPLQSDLGGARPGGAVAGLDRCQRSDSSPPPATALRLVALQHGADSVTYSELYWEWLVGTVFAQLGRPVRLVVHQCGSETAAPAASAEARALAARLGVHEPPPARPDCRPPVLEDSILVFNQHADALALRLRLYRARARAAGVRRLGLLHLNHEEPWGDSWMLWNNVPEAELLREYAGWDLVLRQYYHAPLARAAHYVPLGPRGRRTLTAAVAAAADPDPDPDPDPVPAASERELDFFFAGRVDERLPQRAELMRVLAAEMPAGVRVGRAEWVERDAYWRLLREAVFAPCPEGNNAETFRLYEALEAGAVPVLRRSARTAHLEHGAAAAGDAPLLLPLPAVFVDEWAELPAVAERLRQPGARDILQARAQEWYAGLRVLVGARVRTLVDAFLGTEADATGALETGWSVEG